MSKAWARASETQVLESAAYFFDQIDRLLTTAYDPTVEDILRARQKTTGPFLFHYCARIALMFHYFRYYRS